MLSQDSIDRLLQPIIERQEKINLYVIVKIAEQIKKVGEMSPSAMHQLERLYKTGSDIREINKTLAVLAGLQVKEIKKLIRAVALDAYRDSKPFFDYRHKAFIPFDQNAELQRVVKAIEKQTAGEYTNLAKAQAFMIRDLKNPKKLIPAPPAKAYQSVVDEAIQAVQSGTVDYHTAMRRTLTQLSDSGLRVTYQAESGKVHTQAMDAAVRRNVLDGVRAINQGVQDEVGKEFGADGKEITVHRYSAPDHEPIQGHQFSNEEYDKLQNQQDFRDYKGNKFEAIKRPIGVWNCRHFTYSIILGHSKPIYSDKQLQDFINENQKGYTDKNGKHRTMYECTQEQRRMERDIRYAKQAKIAADAAGDDAKAAESVAKVSSLSSDYRAFSEACGLKVQLNRIRVDGYTDKIGVKE